MLTSLTARRLPRTPETGRSCGPGLRAGPGLDASPTRSPRWPQTRTSWRPTGRYANGQRSQRALGHSRHHHVCHRGWRDCGDLHQVIHSFRQRFAQLNEVCEISAHKSVLVFCLTVLQPIRHVVGHMPGHHRNSTMRISTAASPASQSPASWPLAE